MKRDYESLSQATPTQETRPEKWRTVWIKSSDNLLVKMIEWQVHQLKVLQLLLAHHGGITSEDNPIDLSPLTKDNGSKINAPAATLNLLKTALEKSNDVDAFAAMFYETLTQEEQATLINGAFELEADGLTALLIQIKLPDAQKMMANKLITPIVTYLLTKLKFEFIQRQQTYTPFDPLPKYDIKISPDGDYVISSHKYPNLQTSWVWHIPTKNYIGLIRHPFHQATFSKTGKYILYKFDNDYACYNTDTLSLLCRLITNCMDFSPDDQYCLMRSINHMNLLVLSLANSQQWIQLKELKGHTDQVNCVQFSPDGQYIVSGSNGDNNNLIMWNGKTFEKIKVLDAHKYNVTNVAFTPDSKYIISYDSNHNHVIWDTETKNYIGEFQNTDILPYNPLKNNTYLYSPDTNYLKLYQAHWNKLTKKIMGTKHPLIPLGNQCSLDSIINKNNMIKGHNTDKNKDLFLLKTITDINYATQSPNCHYIALSNDTKNDIVGLLSQTDRIKLLPNLPTGLFQTIYFSPKNDYIIAAHRNTISEQACLVFSLWNMSDIETINNIVNERLNLSQARFMYRLYIAQLNNVKVVINEKDQDYAAYKSLPQYIKTLIDKYLPFKVSY